MSLIGNKPVAILDGVKVNVAGTTVSVEGPQGKISYEHRPEVKVALSDDGKEVVVTREKDDKNSRAFHGLTRALLNNMVIGVKEGYEKKLELHGVGYVANIQGKILTMRVGYANEI